MFIKQIPGVSGFVTATVHNTKISEVENKIPFTSSLMTTTVHNTKISEAVNKKLDSSSLVISTVFNANIEEVKDKIPDHANYITTQEFNKLTAENFKGRLKQVDLVSKNYFDNKLISFNKNLPQIKRNIWRFKRSLIVLLQKTMIFS